MVKPMHAFMPILVYSLVEEPYAHELASGLRLKDLLFLRRIAERKSLSAAASEFGLTQPAGSRWLRDLEALFRGHLFTRDRMVGMTPTPLGELVVQRARALFADVDSLASDIDAHRAGRGGRLQLGVIPYFSAQLLDQVVSKLVGDHGMVVSVVEAATEPLLEALRMQRLHAVVGRCPGEPLAGGLRQEVLFTQQACLVVHRESGLATRSAKLASFAELRWVVPPTNSPSWQAMSAAFAAAKAALPSPVVETASTKLVHALVASHRDMVAVLPADIGMDLEQLGGVRVVPFPAAFRMPPVGLIAHERHWDFSIIATLRKTLRALVVRGRR
jgi:DNA-binding transcriptional LysR family regulator